MSTPEHPRPTFPGDFISCDYYRHETAFTANFPTTGVSRQLELNHDGLVNDQLYEIVFGAFLVTLTDPAGVMTLRIAYGGPTDEPVVFFAQEYTGATRHVVESLSCFFAPRLSYPAEIPYKPFVAHLRFTGTGQAQVKYGVNIAPLIFGVRPTDETNSGRFRLITE